ncbi:unnamed protein product [Musa acuminata subsp. malaccensis]|uniref:non-specific serine/threonine protein kinase n=1 Tax=Musa acuminata subsp. malaccensis TaxID=214687 RepID=A0A8D6ZKC6_MUSAM|nr:unnamed protein product [Musa acuminata subsp. malaccensis]
MVRLLPYDAIFLLSSLSLLLLGTSDDRLTPGEFISLNETLVSDAGEFVFGFFSPTNSTGDFYAGVWYNIPQRTVIWVANREQPINDSSATLRISDDSNLVIMDSEGGIFWSSNLSGFGTPGNDTAAVLLNSGSLVLRANSHNILWQSFDHPTDTFVPGMKIQYNFGKQSARYITSWKDTNDPSPGNFSLGIGSSTAAQLLIWSGTKLYWRSQVWIGKMFTGSRAINTTAVAYLTVLEDDDEIGITLSVSDASLYIRYTLNYLGQIELLIWDNSSKNWTKYSSVPNDKCETYGWCGQFAYCDSTESVPACKCMEGFKPKVQSDWENGNFSAGCTRKKALRCGDGDGFLRVEGMKLPDHVVFLRNRNIGDCRTACLTNCSCTAYAYSDVTTGNETISGCLIWVGELIDTEMVSSGGEDLYLRLMDISSKTKTRRIVIIVSLPASIVSLACIFIFWKFSEVFGKFTKRSCRLMVRLPPYVVIFLVSSLSLLLLGASDDRLTPGKFISLNETLPHRGPELPLIGFENILCATNNFSDSNKLGQGGFGIVYKGNLPGGQEIAVKRLLRGSRQGLEEFKNEVILIAKLQHRNLVKLLACCIHGEEKLLVYEYMPNKSLDFFLFDPRQKAKLDWGKRFNIIKGIARALLYLHQDSRLRIIHRDLKASNILLDAEMNPKISDFGMARIFGGNQDEANTNRVVGTYGYMSPEYAMEGLFSVKSDVYSYGVLLLEIVSGFRNSSFPLAMDSPNLLAYAWELWNEGNAEDYVDPSIAGSCARAEVARSIHVGLLKTKARRIVIIVSLSAIIVCLACIFILWKFSEVFGVFKDRKKGKLLCVLSSSTDFANNISASNEFIEGKPHQGPELPLIGFENILLATNNFSDSNKLGQGGFGIVYKGKLSGGQEIAVKRLVRGSGQGLEEFKNEVILIAKLQHRNLVRLLGCCIHGEEKLLVYEYMPNKSLDFLLFADPTQKTKLDWGKRFNIIKRIARALLYLHQDSRLRIIHRDLKASNVLLDEEMNPKVSDFGLARIFGGNQDEGNTDRVVGTYGYMSPEYAMEGLFSVKSDVYSYGVLLLEIVSGFRNSSFPLAMDSPNLLAYAWQLWNEGNAEDYVDPSIAGSCARAEVVRSIHVGLLCVQDSPSDRPAMSSVVFMLENEEATISAAPKQSTFTVRRNQNPHRGGDSRDDNIEMCSYNNVTITTTEGR